jgi:hypothetical protein
MLARNNSHLAIKALSFAFALLFSKTLPAEAPFQTKSSSQSRRTSSKYRSDINVMAPLNRIENWDAFKEQLRTLKNSGIQALTTDIWWGIFESQGDNIFDWTYYQQYAQIVEASGLKWIPILSFHQCGGNTGDDCNIPLPKWVWDLGPEEDMKFRDENGFVNGEYVSHFYKEIYEQYAEAMESFGLHFKKFSKNIPKIYLSLGPAGELRYPSYYARAGWYYPHRGTLQSYSPSALRDFRNYALKTYGNNLDALNSAWQTRLSSPSQILPPSDGDRFFRDGVKTAYGRDFMAWYQGRLIHHLDQMIRIARDTISTQMPEVRYGAKIAGVHWLYNSPVTPHAAEYTAGYYNYADILSVMKALDVDLTFTCLEMDDVNKWTSPYFSAPQTLLDQISTIAVNLGLNINGENALAISNDPTRYDNIARALSRYAYKSFTLLRMQNIVDPFGAPKPEMAIFKRKIIEPFSKSL